MSLYDGSRGAPDVDWGSSAEATERRRRVAEAAKQRLAVIDHAAHYTSTVRVSEARGVVDHRDSRGYGVQGGRSSYQWPVQDFADSRTAPRGGYSTHSTSPSRDSTGTRVSTIGAGSYASMYDDRLAGDVSHDVSWDRPTETRRWAGGVETKINDVSRQMKRAAIGHHNTGQYQPRTSKNTNANVQWEEDTYEEDTFDANMYGEDITYDKNLNPIASEKKTNWVPKKPQTYKRNDENAFDLDDGYGNDWRRTVPKSPKKPGWNSELYIPEELQEEEEEMKPKRDERRVSVTAKIGQPAWDFGDQEPERPVEVYDVYEQTVTDNNLEHDVPTRGRGVSSTMRQATPNDPPGIQRTTSIGTAKKLAALKAARSAQRPTSRGDALRTHKTPPYAQTASKENDLSSAFPPRNIEKRVQYNTHPDTGFDEDKSVKAVASNWGKTGAPSEFPEAEPFMEPKNKTSYHQARVGHNGVGQNKPTVRHTKPTTSINAPCTTDVLCETWEEFGTTLRPSGKVVTRTGLKPVVVKKKGTGAGVGTIKEIDNDSFGGYSPPVNKLKRQPSLSSSPARVGGGTGHITTDISIDLRGMTVPDGADVGPTALKQCDTCGRKFNQRALTIHQKSCVKVFASKRQAFDVAKQRAEGTDLARFKRMGGGGGGSMDDDGLFGYKSKAKTSTVSQTKRSVASSGKAPPKWKKESERFRAGLRAVRTGEAVDPEYDEDLVPCPHCSRSFNEHAAERHIPQCTNIKAKPSRLVRGGGRGAHVTAMAKNGFGGKDYSRTRAF